MATTGTADFLVEIGTEELPPKALKDLAQAFAGNLGEALRRERLPHGAVAAYASPRRLAVLVQELVPVQEDREAELRGPPAALAYDEEGRPTAAARAFAKKCGVSVDALGQTETPKGAWVTCRRIDRGQRAAVILPGLVAGALDRLPVPRRMRWGASDIEFARPVHWVLMLHGRDIVQGQVLGLPAGNATSGHRFLADGKLVVPEPAAYLELLERQGFVLADFAARKKRIVAGVERAAADAGGVPVGSDALFDEVTALTEWPVPMAGHFDDSFLKLPREVIVATLTTHQRYFPVADGEGNLQAAFVTVANLESRDPDKVRGGNERVIRPRLADAAFFWDHDRRVALADRSAALHDVVYSQGLGSLHDKSARVGRLGVKIAARLGSETAAVERAAFLSRCDLTTGMVGEFPELQGVMGRYYAESAGEPLAVAEAIGEMYLPRFAGDVLPFSDAGRILALADKLDSLTGQFALGKKPSGNRDPFGLRRAALGVVRIIIECRLELDLPELLAMSLADQPVADKDASLAGAVYDFVVERMKGWYREDDGITAEVFEAVRLRRPASLPDFDARLKAVAAFVELEPAASLAAANKRIANILRQAGGQEFGIADAGLLEDEAEVKLFDALNDAEQAVQPLIKERAYTDALQRLAGLRDPVDRFFDDVMVMTGNDAVRRNRLALLGRLRALFLEVADISSLSLG